MVGIVLWLLLLVFCWPLALVALVLFPLVWLLSAAAAAGGDRGRGGIRAAASAGVPAGAPAGRTPLR